MGQQFVQLRPSSLALRAEQDESVQTHQQDMAKRYHHVFKVYVSPEEKAHIQAEARSTGAKSVSHYLKQKALAASQCDAAITELIHYLIVLGKAQPISPTTTRELWHIAQAVLDGLPTNEATKLIAEVCQREN